MSSHWEKGLAATKKGWSTEKRLHAPLDDLNERFMRRCDRMNLSPKTKHTYTEKLLPMIAFFKVRKRKYWQQVTKEDVQAWIERIQERPTPPPLTHVLPLHRSTLKPLYN